VGFCGGRGSGRGLRSSASRTRRWRRLAAAGWSSGRRGQDRWPVRRRWRGTSDPRRSDLDPWNREITIRGKGGRQRVVKVGHEAARALDRYLRSALVVKVATLGRAGLDDLYATTRTPWSSDIRLCRIEYVVCAHAAPPPNAGHGAPKKSFTVHHRRHSAKPRRNRTRSQKAKGRRDPGCRKALVPHRCPAPSLSPEFLRKPERDLRLCCR
jgi:hypothetical protein